MILNGERSVVPLELRVTFTIRNSSPCPAPLTAAACFEGELGCLFLVLLGEACAAVVAVVGCGLVFLVVTGEFGVELEEPVLLQDSSSWVLCVWRKQ